MDIMDAIKSRHSVRAYTEEAISESDQKELRAEIERCNAEGGLHIQLVCNDPRAFDSTMAHYGKFSNVSNYLLIAGPASPTLDERGGYSVERLVLLAQQLGLNTCWVALTFKKRYVRRMLESGDKLVVVIALGHGATQGGTRKSKEITDVCKISQGTELPDWFISGVDAALLAPTAINQQSFEFELLDKTDADGRRLVSLRNKGGMQSRVDLGIVRLHFELGVSAIGGSFAWEEGWR